MEWVEGWRERSGEIRGRWGADERLGEEERWRVTAKVGDRWEGWRAGWTMVRG